MVFKNTTTTNNDSLFINIAVASKYPLKIFRKFFIFNYTNLKKNIFINPTVASKYSLKCHWAQFLGNFHFKSRKTKRAGTSLATVCQWRWVSQTSILSWCKNLHLSGTRRASLTNSPTTRKENSFMSFSLHPSGSFYDRIKGRWTKRPSEKSYSF